MTVPLTKPKRRERQHYYRQGTDHKGRLVYLDKDGKPIDNDTNYYKRITVSDGEMLWVRTELLPSDPESMRNYLRKGFRTSPPEGSEWDLNKTAREAKAAQEKIEMEAKVRAEVESKLEAENTQKFEALFTELATLKKELGEKGKEGRSSDKVGRPKRK